AHPGSNSLVISDRSGNVERMVSIIHRIDTVADSGVEVIPLQHASAAEVARILTQLADTKADLGGDASKVFADERTNSILLSSGTATILAHEEDNALVISAPPAVFRELASVIRQLDIRRAQVLIEAVIAEVSDETANELGVQWQFPIGDKAHAVGGTNFTGNSP